MAILSDRQLLVSFRQGDACALEALFERYESPVFQFLMGILRDHHRAEDALQETFIKALRDSGAVAPEHFRGWLFTVAYREALLEKRRRKLRPRSADEPAVAFPDPNPSGEDLAEQRDQARRLRELVGQLPTQQRAVIEARIYEGKRYREIAADLGCPLNTALARMHEGLKRLRLLWEGAREPV
jgi:RNA polymerase sigma-70 factor (ECF subfamily)